MPKLITIQKVFAENRLLHSFLVSQGLNKQINIFFLENNNEYSNSILMLSPLGHLFRFCIEDGKYKPIRFEDPDLLDEMLSIVDNAVIMNRYPFYKETLSMIRANLGYTTKAGLF